MAYLLDTNVFIEVKNRYYGFDFCPAFWDWIIAKNIERKVFSIEKVGDEIEKIKDDLADWIKKCGNNFFIKPVPGVLAALAQVNNWATAQTYDTAAVRKFMQGADCYLVAHALEGGYEVVTLETLSQPAPIKRIRIPNVCNAFGINYMTPFEMLRRERAHFVLGSAA